MTTKHATTTAALDAAREDYYAALDALDATSVTYHDARKALDDAHKALDDAHAALADAREDYHVLAEAAELNA